MSEKVGSFPPCGSWNTVSPIASLSDTLTRYAQDDGATDLIYTDADSTEFLLTFRYGGLGDWLASH